jgi:hypothetical protein
LPPTFYRGCWHVVSRDLFRGYCPSSSPRKALYNPKAFIAHAALLHQAFAHCAIFPTAATRRCLARVSVPVWGTTLSGPLPVVALVGRYPTNKLMGRRPLPKRLATFIQKTLTLWITWGISSPFEPLFPTLGQVTYVLLTHSPLGTPPYCYKSALVRLACIRHAASVHPEPGSNSP